MRKGRFLGMATIALALGIFVSAVSDAEARCGRRCGRRARGCGSCATACNSGGCVTNGCVGNGCGTGAAAAPAPAPAPAADADAAPPAPAPAN